jgi:hypothetical protein
MSDAIGVDFLKGEVKRLERALQAALGHVGQLQENARSDHHLIIVLRERIGDLTRDLNALKREV